MEGGGTDVKSFYNGSPEKREKSGANADDLTDTNDPAARWLKDIRTMPFVLRFFTVMHHFHVSANHYLIFLVDPGTSVTLYRADERKKKEIKRKREREIFSQ